MQSTAEVLRTFSRDTRLVGRTALVTGSSSGIGGAIAHALAASGAPVVVTGRDSARTGAVAGAITAAGRTAHAVVADLGAAPEAVRALAGQVTAALGGRVDIVVDDAGIHPAAPTAATTDSDLEAVWSTTICAPHVLVSALAPAMAQRGSGSTVNVGSWMARTGAAEYGLGGVRANTVAPGATSTPGNAGSEQALAAMTATIPTGQPVRPNSTTDDARWS